MTVDRIPRPDMLPPIRLPLSVRRPLAVLRTKGEKETVVDMVVRRGESLPLFLRGRVLKGGKGEIKFYRPRHPYDFRLSEITFEEAEGLSQYFAALARTIQKVGA